MTYTKENINELLARVKAGNDKLNKAWDQLVAMDHTSQVWKDGVEKWSQANELLSTFCTQLKALGYNDCLYIENGKKTRTCLGEGLGCRVCPSIIAYWEKEYDAL